MDHSNDQVSKPMTSASDTRVVNESSSQEDQDSRSINRDASTQTDNHPPDDSIPLGTLTEITIDKKFEMGYLVSAKFQQVLLQGVLFHPADNQRAPSSPAEGLSMAKVAASLYQSLQPHIDLNKPPTSSPVQQRHIDLNQPPPLSPELPGLDPQYQPRSSSDPLRISEHGTIDGKVGWGYLVSVKLGYKVLRGVLYHSADKQRAPSSQAEGTSTAIVAATSNQAPSSQAEGTSTAMVAATSNQAPPSQAEGTSTAMVAATSNQAPSSQAEGTSTAMVAATSNQAPPSQAEGTSTAMVATTSNQAEGTVMDAEFQDFLETLTLPEQTISPRKPSLQPSDLYADSAAGWNMLPTIDVAHKNLLLTQITQQHYLLQPYSDSMNQLGKSSDSVFYQEPDDSLNLPTAVDTLPSTFTGIADSHQGGGGTATNVLPESAFQGGENTSPLLMQSQPIPILMQETQTLPSTAVVSSLQTGTSIISGSGPGSTSGNINVDDESNRPPVSIAAGGSKSATNASDEIQGDKKNFDNT